MADLNENIRHIAAITESTCRVDFTIRLTGCGKRDDLHLDDTIIH